MGKKRNAKIFFIIGIIYVLLLIVILNFISNQFISGFSRGVEFGVLVGWFIVFGIPAWILFILAIRNYVQQKKEVENE